MTKRNGNDEHIPLHVQTVRACYDIARDEAERYQRSANLAADQTDNEGFIIYGAKRDAASRIARLIRYGPALVERRKP
jgi:hypothetical protein